MSTNADKTLNGTPEPFRRPVIWGRPPATIFRAGPLPSGGGSPLSGGPRLGAVPGILSGSMIPRAAPAAGAAPAPAPAPPVAARAPASVARDHAADLTVRPLPPVEAEPVRRPAPAPAAAPAPAPAPVAAVDEAPVRKPSSRLPLYAGIALATLTVLAVAGWILTRPPAATPAPAPAPVVAPAPAIPIPEAAAPAALPAPAPVSEPAAPAPVAATPPARPAAIRPAPVRTPPPEVVTPPPATAAPIVIEIAPAPVPRPAPTEAESPPTDPDAPIATRPQPIG